MPRSFRWRRASTRQPGKVGRTSSATAENRFFGTVITVRRPVTRTPLEQLDQVRRVRDVASTVIDRVSVKAADLLYPTIRRSARIDHGIRLSGALRALAVLLFRQRVPPDSVSSTT